MTRIPNRFGTARPPEGQRLDMNFRAVEDALVAGTATAATNAAAIATNAADIATVTADVATLGQYGTYRVASQTISNATWTNIIWTLHLAGSDWRVSGSNHLVRPDVAAVFMPTVAVWWTSGFTSSDLFATRIFVNGGSSTNIGENRASSVNSSPAQTTSGVAASTNGSTTYFFAQVFQGTGSNQTLEARMTLHAIAT